MRLVAQVIEVYLRPFDNVPYVVTALTTFCLQIHIRKRQFAIEKFDSLPPSLLVSAPLMLRAMPSGGRNSGRVFTASASASNAHGHKSKSA